MIFRQEVTINQSEMMGVEIPETTVRFLEEVDTLNSKVSNVYSDPKDYKEYIVPTKALQE